jgi:hypothetical protein
MRLRSIPRKKCIPSAAPPLGRVATVATLAGERFPYEGGARISGSEWAGVAAGAGTRPPRALAYRRLQLARAVRCRALLAEGADAHELFAESLRLHSLTPD